jgi:CMP-2-keto-3-deoxyoctulosonic acid synthetase
MSNTAILIPARYGSTRYPGKPLAMFNGTEINTSEDAEAWHKNLN